MNTALRELLALEPVRIRAVVGALIGLALAFGVDLDGNQIMEAVDALLPLIGSLVIFVSARAAVTPNASVAVRTDEIQG